MENQKESKISDLKFPQGKKDIEVVSIREDDGYSGSPFQCPGFQLMMQDVMDKKSGCPREEWIIVENMHEAIISKELFEQYHFVTMGER